MRFFSSEICDNTFTDSFDNFRQKTHTHTHAMPKERKVRGKRHNKKKAEEQKKQQEEAAPIEIYDDVPMPDADFAYGG